MEAAYDQLVEQDEEQENRQAGQDRKPCQQKEVIIVDVGELGKEDVCDKFLATIQGHGRRGGSKEEQT